MEERIETGQGQQKGESRQQMAFTWKAGYREQWQPAFDAWAERQPKGQQAAQDYILFLIRQNARAGNSGAIRARFDNLNLKSLADAHYARRAAEDRMMEMIADLITGAREQAESEVKAEMDMLRETAKFAQEQARKTDECAKEQQAALQEEIEKSKVTAEKTLAELKIAKAEVIQLTREVANLQTDLEETEKQAKETAENLETAKVTIEGLHEKIEKLREKNEATANDLETTRKDANGWRQAVNQAVDRENKLKADIRHLQGENADLCKKLKDTEQAANENWQETEKADKELQEARQKLQEAHIRIATLEGELKAAGSTSKALSDAIAAIASMKRTKWPEDQQQPPEGQQPPQTESE